MLVTKKASLILILKILQEYTDEEHFLTQAQIIEKISHQYNLELERKSVSSSLELLEELDYDIVKGPHGGYALLTRTFDKTEASYLIDAIFSSRSINAKRAKEISNSIYSCLSKYERKNYSYIYKSSDINRTNNEDVLYNISIIQEAIKRGKRVSFQYLDYDSNGNKIVKRGGHEYKVSPYYLINNFGRYYLLGNYRDKYRPINVFRIDYMSNVYVAEDWSIKKLEDLENPIKDFSISKYINEHIYLFGGEVVDAELELSSESIILQIKDWFGENANIKKVDDKIHAYVRCDDMALYYWIMQYSDCVKVVTPHSLVDKVKSGLKSALEKYE